MTKVLYVMGSGRSGSTLLDVILGTHPDIVGCGELWSILEPDLQGAGFCSCGVRPDSCTFWSQVLERLSGKYAPRGFERVRECRVRHDRARYLPLRLLSSPTDEYCSDAQVLFEAVSEVAGKSVVLDSTKQVGRAASLLGCPGLDVFLVHLVRDARGVMWSRRRDIMRRSPWVTKAYHGSGGVNLAKWLAQNTLARVVARKASEDRSLLLRYEDLVSRPAQEIRRIGDWCGIDMTPVLANLHSRGDIRAEHQIGGNQAARSGKSPAKLVLDEEWRNCLPVRDRLLFQLLGRPVAHLLKF